MDWWYRRKGVEYLGWNGSESCVDVFELLVLIYFYMWTSRQKRPAGLRDAFFPCCIIHRSSLATIWGHDEKCATLGGVKPLLLRKSLDSHGINSLSAKEVAILRKQ